MNKSPVDAPKCGLCGGVALRCFLKAADIATGEEFELLECASCSVKMTYPVPHDLATHYEGVEGSGMRKDSYGLHAFFKEKFIEHELTRIKRLSSPSIYFDIGCGAGAFSKVLTRQGLKVISIDSSPERPALLQDTSVPYLKINYDDYRINGLCRTNGAVAILRHVLEHIRDPRVLIKTLKEYGVETFYIAVPNIDSPKTVIFKEYSWHLDPPRHIWHFNMRSLTSLLGASSLTVVGYGYDTIPIIVPSIYRFLRLKMAPSWLTQAFYPNGPLATLSLPLDFLLPRDVIWIIARI